MTWYYLNKYKNMSILLFQLFFLIFITGSAIIGRGKGLVIATAVSIIWTIFQVFTMWLSIFQFITIFIAYNVGKGMVSNQVNAGPTPLGTGIGATIKEIGKIIRFAILLIFAAIIFGPIIKDKLSSSPSSASGEMAPPSAPNRITSTSQPHSYIPQQPYTPTYYTINPASQDSKSMQDARGEIVSYEANGKCIYRQGNTLYDAECPQRDRY